MFTCVYYVIIRSTDRVNVEVKEMLRMEVREGFEGKVTDGQISRNFPFILWNLIEFIHAFMHLYPE